MRNRRAGLGSLLACTAVLAAVTTACGSDSGTSADGKIELTIATFNQFGYEELLKEYEAAHPNIKVSERKTGQAADHHKNLFTKMAAGSGLSDVEGVEEGYLSQVMTRAGQFNNLKEIGPNVDGRWLDWKTKSVTAKGGELIGYGTDIGPLAMCYRKDLLEAGGIPTDEAGIAATFATWDSYFAAGKQYAEKTGKAWFDSAAQIFNPMHNQAELGYFDKDDKLVIDSNGDKAIWGKVTAAVAQGQSAKLKAWTPEWETGFRESAFATKTCPAWLLGNIEKNSGPEHKGKWVVTGSFPDGGGNWGGSFLTVPKQSKHPKEAAELAAWLTAPEQQIKAFKAKNTFPSQLEALDNPELTESTNEYFGQQVGKLYAEQAKKVDVAQYKGPKDGQIQDDIVGPALLSVEQGTNADEAWKKVVEDAQKATK
ncbi:carbohydrate ABC transporter substrate-binding protein [Actinosynnema pretiosum subsp. pretiosum]|uniref:Extracellular solute-binding protein family 1 n=2 Tax=Actinosynnema TaxID=40566 RepID=C6WCW6_ACTMD|nr:extracellular solute-binding protein family 1 [Actinosynnema mirum DSM 43827]QUF06569.1 carbohydrate ABC transporter substrate-binding protein [Actinosynnema pretiosum subsp. pretiosum]